MIDLFTVIEEMLTPELAPLIAVLYVIGIYLKKYQNLDDRHIPLALGVISIIMNSMYLFAFTEVQTSQQIVAALLTAITQGILFAAAAVYGNTVYKCETNRG